MQILASRCSARRGVTGYFSRVSALLRAAPRAAVHNAANVPILNPSLPSLALRLALQRDARRECVKMTVMQKTDGEEKERKEEGKSNSSNSN